MKFRPYLLIICIAFACKTTKPVLDDTVEVEETTPLIVEPDTTYLITRAGDTLVTLDEEVDITLNRLLPDSVTIVAVGDIMGGTNFPDKSYLPREKGAYLWDQVRPILQDADITFGNLEGTILDDGGEQKECNNPKLCYLFRSPEYLAENFRDCGFDLMSVANNHANDFGVTGRKNTQRVLDSLGISHAGSIDQPYTISKIGNLRIGFCAFAPNRGTVSIHQYENIKATIQHNSRYCHCLFSCRRRRF